MQIRQHALAARRGCGRLGVTNFSSRENKTKA